MLLTDLPMVISVTEHILISRMLCLRSHKCTFCQLTNRDHFSREICMHSDPRSSRWSEQGLCWKPRTKLLKYTYQTFFAPGWCKLLQSMSYFIILKALWLGISPKLHCLSKGKSVYWIYNIAKYHFTSAICPKAVNFKYEILTENLQLMYHHFY